MEDEPFFLQEYNNNSIQLTCRPEICSVAPVARQVGLHPCFLHIHRLAGVDHTFSSISYGGQQLHFTLYPYVYSS